MVYAVAVLLISSLTTVGLIAVWAATSPGNWFWRTMAFLGAMSPLLLIPAYEPFVAFVIQGAVVAAGVQLARWRQVRKSGEPFLKSQFSLKTVLLAMVPAAVLIAVWARVPEIGWDGWLSVVLIGVVAGISTLLGLWIVAGDSLKWRFRVLLGLLLAVAGSLAIVIGEWFVGSPTENSSLGVYVEDSAAAWFGIAPAVALIIAALTGLTYAPRRQHSNRELSRSRLMIFVILAAATASPALATCWALMNRLPIPVATSPNPNGYDDFIAATQLLPARPLVSTDRFDPDTATEQFYEQVLAEVRPSLERARMGMDCQVLVPIDYTSLIIQVDTFGRFRSIARGFRAEGRWAERSGDWGAAADSYLDGMQFGLLLARGGLIIDDLVGIACVGVAEDRLYEAKDSIPAQVLPGIINRLKELETLRDPCDDVLHRDAVWSQHAMGWHGHLLLQLAHLVDEEMSVEDGYRFARTRELATLRLLQLELALRLYEHDHGKHPDSLDALVPKYIEAVPVDPMSPDEVPLHYVKTETGIVPYSVSTNGVDDQGQADPDNWGVGDLRLDVLYAPQPAAATLPGSDQDAEADENENN